MPLSVGNSVLLYNARIPPQPNHMPHDSIINVRNITETSKTVNVGSSTNSEILIDTPADEYFISSSWTLNVILPSLDEYCTNIMIGLTQSTRSWPTGTSCTINFYQNGKNGKIVATTLFTGHAKQFHKFIISSDSQHQISIHKQEYTALTMIDQD